MKKILAMAMAMTLSMALVFTGCSSEKKEDTAKKPQTEQNA